MDSPTPKKFKIHCTITAVNPVCFFPNYPFHFLCTPNLIVMNLERYDYVASADHLEYKFFSQGPKGRIEKLVRFQPFITTAGIFFNLGFGDWNENTRSMDDSVVSNNKDVDKVLTTIAHIVMDFTARFPDTEVYAEGGTASRFFCSP